MDMKEYICNYAVVRFLPYPETGEFVCVGVALVCAETRYFGYKLEMKRRDRVTGFFPELDVAAFTQGRRIFEQQLQHVRRTLMGTGQQEQMKLPFLPIDPIHMFKELVRPRESLFRFGGIGTVVTHDPATELERLNEHYVNRQFAQREEYQEAIMGRHLQKLFRKESVAGYREEMIGSDTYKFRIPFVRGETADFPTLRMIKPLNLTQTETTRIYDHGELWTRRIERLLNLNARPESLLLPVKMADVEKRRDAAREICEGLHKLDIKTLEFGQHSDILAFAKAI